MGYKPQRDIYELRFQEYPGLEITTKGASLGNLLDISAIQIKLGEESRKEIEKVFKFIAKRIITWNIEHPDVEENDSDEYPTAIELLDGKSPLCPKCGMKSGAPMPTTVEALYCLDMRFVMKIFFGWMQSVASLPVPKGMSSENGENGTEILMRQLGELQNLSKLPEPS